MVEDLTQKVNYNKSGDRSKHYGEYVISFDGNMQTIIASSRNLFKVIKKVRGSGYEDIAFEYIPDPNIKQIFYAA